jgi:hypothetical protein
MSCSCRTCPEEYLPRVAHGVSPVESSRPISPREGSRDPALLLFGRGLSFWRMTLARRAGFVAARGLIGLGGGLL